jgi:hypothetical protein
MHHFVKQVLSLAIALSVTCTIPTVWANHHEHDDSRFNPIKTREILIYSF